MDCNLDLDLVAKAALMKDNDSAAQKIGEAILEAAENAGKYFAGSLELDITRFVTERIGKAKDESFDSAVKRKIQSHAGCPAPAPKRRGRKPKVLKEAEAV